MPLYKVQLTELVAVPVGTQLVNGEPLFRDVLLIEQPRTLLLEAVEGPAATADLVSCGQIPAPWLLPFTVQCSAFDQTAACVFHSIARHEPHAPMPSSDGARTPATRPRASHASATAATA